MIDIKLKYDFDELYNLADNLSSKHDFDTFIMDATQQIARVLHDMLLKNTPVKTGNLRKNWGGENLRFTVIQTKTGFFVEFKNDAMNEDKFKYGWVVNYGHKTVNGSFVPGRFFVERSVANVENTRRLTGILNAELNKWWDWCINGK